MRGTLLTLAVLGIAYGLCGSGACRAADGDVTCKGTFSWSNEKNQKHDIKGVFTPNGDKKWNVVWTFTWKGGAQTWKGTAEGDLTNGEVKGEGLHPNGKRTFSFVGAAKDGNMEIKHTETTGGRPKDTGVMVIKKE
ncbi:MAG: hypothetical protein M5U26_12465 [Planctomycetota bacterium]|nr:hypothetical protein [Planctomycetota bacterium]